MTTGKNQRIDKKQDFSPVELGPPTHTTTGECCLPPGYRGDALAGAGVGAGGPNSDEGTDTVVL
jgi:hypothetical protein